MTRAIVAVALLLALPLSTVAEVAVDMQSRIKAAFLYKFTAFVDWPDTAFASADSPVVMGVAGSETIAKELERAASGRKLGGRPIEVRRVDHGADPATCCQLLFVADSQGAGVDEWLQPTRGRPVLTVTDVAQSQPDGSVINFVTMDDHVRFDISRGAARRNGLRLRSQLLTVARRTTP